MEDFSIKNEKKNEIIHSDGKKMLWFYLISLFLFSG